MNLHILPDSKFSERFISNLEELDLLSTNKIIIRSNEKALKYTRKDVPFAPLYSASFDNICGPTSEYSKVFLHQFSPLMYRWVSSNKFNELNWCPWGVDVYHLPGITRLLFEKQTWEGFSRYNWRKDFLYNLKVLLTSVPFRDKAHAKVNRILTWMHEEFKFIKDHLNVNDPRWEFFFYENALPYESLVKESEGFSPNDQTPIRLVVGNSGTDTNNHLDAIRIINEMSINADLIIPLSYGDKRYTSFLKSNLSFYKNGTITFLEGFMNFDEYIEMLRGTHGLIMNHVRPQGYGNIFIMMALGKPVFFNKNNISLADLNRLNVKWQPIEQIVSYFSSERTAPVQIVPQFTHQNLLRTYKALFQ